MVADDPRGWGFAENRMAPETFGFGQGQRSVSAAELPGRTGPVRVGTSAGQARIPAIGDRRYSEDQLDSRGFLGRIFGTPPLEFSNGGSGARTVNRGAPSSGLWPGKATTHRPSTVPSGLGSEGPFTPTSGAMMRRSSSSASGGGPGSLLRGLSPSARKQNAKASAAALGGDPAQGPAQRKSLRQAEKRLTDTGGGDPFLSESGLAGAAGFEEQVSGVLGALSSLMREREEFNPVAGKSGGPRGSTTRTMGGFGTKSRKGEDAEEEEEEAKQAMRERLMQYRYVRKIEPEAPPLKRPTAEQLAQEKELQNERLRLTGRTAEDPDFIIKRNASPDTLALRRPSSQQRALVSFKARNLEHMSEVNERHYDHLELWDSFWRDDLLRKSEQVGRLMRRRQAALALAKAYAGAECPQRWLTLLVLLEFSMVMRDQLRVRKMSPAELASFGKERDKETKGSLGLRKARKTFKLLSRAINIPSLQGESKKDQEAKHLAIIRMQMRLRLRYREKLVEILWACLGSWKLAGRIVLAFKRFLQNTRRIQKFWRKCRNGRLRHLRKLVERRWLKIERAHLSRELSSDPTGQKDADRMKEAERRLKDTKQGTPQEGARRTKSMTASGPGRPMLALSERIEIALLDEIQRLRFIANEMRTRRFLILPKIHAWEQQMERYWEEVKEWRDEKAADAYLNLKRTIPPPLPPGCPSHVPTEEDIADMVHRARRDLENYARVPTIQESRAVLRRQAQAGGRMDGKDGVPDLQGLDIESKGEEGEGWWEDEEEREMQKMFPGIHAWKTRSRAP